MAGRNGAGTAASASVSERPSITARTAPAAANNTTDNAGRAGCDSGTSREAGETMWIINDYAIPLW
ncbi:hypothetical protein GCM10027288_19980 [Bordetella tumbae]